MSDFNRLVGSVLGIENAIKEGAENGLKQAGARVMGAAKQKLGTYQPSIGEYPAWKVLSPQSIKAKFMSNSGSGKIKKSGKEYLKRYGAFRASGSADDSPLVDTGALRQAITMDTAEVSDGKVYIGVVRRTNMVRQEETFHQDPICARLWWKTKNRLQRISKTVLRK